MRFSRDELLEIIKPHVLRAVVRLQAQRGLVVTEEDLIGAGLSERERQALVQTKRLVPDAESGAYRIQV